MLMATAALLVSAAVVAAHASWAPVTAGHAGRIGGGVDTLSSVERAATGGWIYFVRDSAGRHRVERLRPADGAPHEVSRRVSRSVVDAYTGAPATAGGAILLVQARDSAGLHHERVVLYFASDSNELPLTVWSGRVRNPSWSPDGRWVAIETDERSFGDIVRVDLRTRAATRLTRGTEGNYEPAVSPDGTRIAFVSSRSGNAEVYLMGSDGSNVRRTTASARDSWSPSWSPDGDRLAFVSNRTGRDRIYVVQSDGTMLRPLTGDAGERAPAQPAHSFEGEGGPAWSPDGRTVAFLGRTAGSGTRVYLAALADGAPRALTPAGRDAGHFAWSPNGHLLAVTVGTAREGGLHLVREDGSGWTSVGPVGAWLPRWSR